MSNTGGIRPRAAAGAVDVDANHLLDAGFSGLRGIDSLRTRVETYFAECPGTVP